MSDRNVVFLAGSLRVGSHSSALLRHAAELLPAAWAAEFADDIRLLPHYDADLDTEAPPGAVRQARARVTTASAIVISTPEYNGTIPGGLKNWIDWVTRPARAHPLVGKPVAIIGGSPGSKGAIGAVTWLRQTLGYLGAVVVGEVVAVPDVVSKIAADGTVTPDVTAELQPLVAALVRAVEQTARSTSRTDRCPPGPDATGARRSASVRM